MHSSNGDAHPDGNAQQVMHGDMEIQLQMPTAIGFDLQPSRVPMEWTPGDVVTFLRTYRLPIDAAADCIVSHDGIPINGSLDLLL